MHEMLSPAEWDAQSARQRRLKTETSVRVIVQLNLLGSFGDSAQSSQLS